MIEIFTDATKDLIEGAKLAPLWLRLGYEQTLARFQRSILGPFWLSANLLATAFALAFVFGGLLGAGYRANFPHIISGILAWSLIGGLAAEAGNLFLVNSGIMQSHRLPVSFSAYLHMQKGLVNFATQLIAYFAVLGILRLLSVPSWTIIPGLVVCVVNTFFLCLLIALPSTRFRDVGFMLGFVLQILFFMTPVFWVPSQMSASRRFIVDYNPLAHELELIRQPLLGKMPATMDWVWALGTMGVLIFATITALAMFRKRVIFWL